MKIRVQKQRYAPILRIRLFPEKFSRQKNLFSRQKKLFPRRGIFSKTDATEIYDLLRRFQSRTLRTVIAAVVIKLDFHFGFYEFARCRELELQILNGQSAREPLLFVIRLDAKNLLYLIIGF